MQIKQGVIIHGIQPELILALLLTERIYQLFGAELIITSLIDGIHSIQSLHYQGLAFDSRIRDIARDRHKDLAEQVSEALGSEFDVVLETDHLHVEFQPK